MLVYLFTVASNLMKILTLTDHRSFAQYDSLYELMSQLNSSKGVELFIASRGDAKNTPFFDKMKSNNIWAKNFDEGFSYDNKNNWFNETSELNINDFDGMLLRLDQPVEVDFLEFLTSFESKVKIINSPAGLIKTGSKRFLINFPDLVPSIKLCNTLEDVFTASSKEAIVLKPLRGYGGYGILRLENGNLFQGDSDLIALNSKEASTVIKQHLPCVSMRFLKNISLGDKRIIICNGKILGAVLRVPAQGSWLANLAQGGETKRTEITSEEHQIVGIISKEMQEHGIFLYGLDTLVNDDGKRVLSEINPVNVGGFIQIEEMYNIKIIDKVIVSLCSLWD